MRYFVLSLISITVSATSVAGPSQQELMVGNWKIAPEWTGWFQPECREMAMSIASDGTVTRTTGELEYTSTAKFVNDRHRIRLEESLIEHNSKPACAGHSADKIIRHLEKPSFVSVTHDRLLYYRNEKKSSLIIFKRQ